MRGERKCGTCAYSSLEKVRKYPEKKRDSTFHYQRFCRHSPQVLQVNKDDGWCYQWELKHD